MSRGAREGPAAYAFLEPVDRLAVQVLAYAGDSLAYGEIGSRRNRRAAKSGQPRSGGPT